MQVEVEFRRHAAEAADVDDAPADGGRLLRLIEKRTGHLVDDEVDPFAAGRLGEGFDPAGLARIQREIGAIVAQPCG